MLLAVFVAVCVLFGLAYHFYGGYIARTLRLDRSKPTPAHTLRDGVDYDPAPRMVLFGHHFSAIAGSGPIVGPIVAALAFGWGPALLWIVIGCIFLGSPHDFTCLVASLRNKGKSLGEIGRDFMGPFSYRLFLSFLIIVLLYVLAVFVDLTTATFAPAGAENALAGGRVATSSLIYIALAMVFGVTLRYSKLSAGKLSCIFVPLVFLTIWVSGRIPLMPEMVDGFGLSVHHFWMIVLLIYCAVAAILPVWILLQPRDFLSSFLLYACLLGGFMGILTSGTFGAYKIEYSAFVGWSDPELGSLFPILFVTIACGAISGFHSLVATGTTAKQLDKVADARPIAYGGMLLEGVLATLSVATVMILKSDPNTAPTITFANGLASFLLILGLSPSFISAMALLAVSTFILTTLDAGTRLARFLVQELFGLSNRLWTRTLTSIGVVVIPAVVVFFSTPDKPLWKAIWPAFGATNQLLAAMALFFLFLWWRKHSRHTYFILIPMIFMLIVTTVSLGTLLVTNCTPKGNWIVAGTSVILLVITASILYDALRKVRYDKKHPSIPPGAAKKAR